ncbi:MAG TPA: hypothetical protein VHC72_09925 [Bryobacteraceae bacterium]|nr:hypothetical protein [Bryobacteraceae bacterium]
MLRVVLGGLLGYALIGLLIAVGDAVLPRGPHYYQIVLVTDTLSTVAGGWLCGLISGGDTRAAWGLIVMGEIMGIASAIYLWHTAPHYYNFYLLIMYPPAVWLGATRLAPRGSAVAVPPDAA